MAVERRIELLKFLDEKLVSPEETKDWRDGLEGQGEVMGHMLSQEIFANALLIVGEGKVRLRVIKELLQSLSSTLQDRMTGSVGESDVDLPIFRFPDVQLNEMQQILRYAYTHQWSWSREVSQIAPLLRFLELVKRLGIKNLAVKIEFEIVSLVNSNSPEFFNEKTACSLFTDGVSFGAEKLKNCALIMILRNTKAVFSNVENYRMLTSPNLVELFMMEEFQMEKELDYFLIALNWAKAKLPMVGLQENVQNMRQILKQILPLIRFTQMTLGEFMEQVCPTEILEVPEMFRIQTIFYQKNAGTWKACDGDEGPRKYREDPIDLNSNSKSPRPPPPPPPEVNHRGVKMNPEF